ncbi:uncharacterized protein LTR77_008287 [Saxophila tyrrhenica]|uniref:O-methyltransferase C-terminal domain-containing protein n=1 Tax=Saxophila tyrrhenica TaxID=1690608 RepID=A0AAV9P0Y4_9PEZI|nr:hypothetical protein LTR77_008287 [Saxophila tyrrhenica]
MGLTADLESLGADVATLSRILALQLAATGSPKPTLAANGAPAFPLDRRVQEPRLELIEKATDLLHLATGANDYWYFQAGLYLNYDASIVDVLNQFDFFSKVPLCGSTSYTELSSATALPENLIVRILQYAFTMRIFAPEHGESDRVVHTAFSAHMQRTPALRSWIGHALEEGRPAAVHLAEALKEFHVGKDKPVENLDETPFSLAWPHLKNGNRATFYSIGVDDPKDAWRATRFAEAARETMMSDVEGIENVVEAFHWDGLGNALVVDVGGGDGSLAAMLARKHPKLELKVQDLAGIEDTFKVVRSSDVAGRVSFEAQDFFDAQPRQADVFLLTRVLHNWADTHAVRILRHLANALQPGGRIIICDNAIPGAADANAPPLSVRKGVAGADLHMFTMLNAKERTVEDWERLVQAVDRRLVIAKVHLAPVPGAMKSLIEVKHAYTQHVDGNTAGV